MLRPVFWAFRWVCALALLGFTIAVLRNLFGGPPPGGWGAAVASMALWAAVAGLAARWLLARIGRGDPLEFLDTLEHELTHAAAGYLTFAPPVSLTATLRQGGEVELRRSNPVAALAPYCLPLYAMMLALLTLVLSPAWLAPGRMAAAFLLGSYAWRFLREFHLGQTDFREFGFVFSMVFIAAALPLGLLTVADLAELVDVPWAAAGTDFLERAGRAWEEVRVK